MKISLNNARFVNLIFFINILIGQSINSLSGTYKDLPNGLIKNSDQLGPDEKLLIKTQLQSNEISGISNLVMDETSPSTIQVPKILKTDLNENFFYGYEFFTNSLTLDILKNLPSPSNYRVGPGDEIIVTMWGDTELRQKAVINKDGKIYFEKIGLVSLIGLEFDKAKEILKSRFEKVYSSLKGGKSATTFLEISLGKLKLINIHFLGEINNPGVIPIHPFSTITTGIIQAGGISKTGSLRKIKIIRENKVIAEIDYYQYFKSGDISENIRLQNDDVISIPIRASTIHIDGMLKHPGTFEILKNETIGDLISFAGELEYNADHKVNIVRTLPIEYRSEEESYFKNIWLKLPEDKDENLIDGDKISILPLFINEEKVSINGQVKMPGEYSIFEDMRVNDLLELSGGIFDDNYWDLVFSSRADLIRKDVKDLTSIIMPINLELLKKGDLNQNFILEKNDSLIIYPSNINSYKKVVTIIGEIRNPGEYALDDNMGLNDLILRSGGFKYGAYEKEIEINRVDPFGQNSKFLLKVEKLNLSLKSPQDFINIDKYKLKNRDQIIVRKYPNFQFQKNIILSGEIKFPGVYALETEPETIEMLFERAGGLTPQSFVEGTQIIRDGKRVILDRINRKKVNLSINLIPGDKINIPENNNIIEVVGEVNSPGLVQFKNNLSVMDYIEIAGQLTKNGDRKNISIYYPNGESKGRGIFNRFPKVSPGCKIVVYSKPEELPLDKTTLFSDVTSVLIQSISLLIMVERISGN
jgi:polysaccharide biosynthesis/export protein